MQRSVHVLQSAMCHDDTVLGPVDDPLHVHPACLPRPVWRECSPGSREASPIGYVDRLIRMCLSPRLYVLLPGGLAAEATELVWC